MGDERGGRGKGAGVLQFDIGRDTNAVTLSGQVVGQVEITADGRGQTAKAIFALSSSRGALRLRVEYISGTDIETVRRLASGDWVMVIGCLVHIGSGAIGVRAVSVYSLNRYRPGAQDADPVESAVTHQAAETAKRVRGEADIELRGKSGSEMKT